MITYLFSLISNLIQGFSVIPNAFNTSNNFILLFAVPAFICLLADTLRSYF